MSIYSAILDGISKLTEGKNAKLAVSGFAISTLVIVVAIAIVSFSFDGKEFHFLVAKDLSIAFVLSYFSGPRNARGQPAGNSDNSRSNSAGVSRGGGR